MTTRFSVTVPDEVEPVLRQYATDSGLSLSAATIALLAESLGLEIDLKSAGRPPGSRNKPKQEVNEDEYAF